MSYNVGDEVIFQETIGRENYTRSGTVVNVYDTRGHVVVNYEIAPGIRTNEIIDINMPNRSKIIEVVNASVGGGKRRRITKKRITKKRITKKRITKKRITKKRITKKRITKKRITKKRKTKRK